jgi:hypothetical protein
MPWDIFGLVRALQFGAGFNASVEKNSRRNHVADRPARFAIKRLDLGIAGVRWIRFDDRVSPETTIVRSFNIDGEGCVTNVSAIDLDFGTCRLRDDLDFHSWSHDVRVRCASAAHQKNGEHQERKNGAEGWEGTIHESSLIRNGSGSSRILSLNLVPTAVCPFPPGQAFEESQCE